MSIELIEQSPSAPIADSWAKLVATDKFYNLGVSNPVDYDFSADTIKQGTLINIGGSNYQATSVTAITGTPSDFVKITHSGATATSSYVSSLSGVTWSSVYNFYQDGSGYAYLFNEAKQVSLGSISSPKTIIGKYSEEAYAKQMTVGSTSVHPYPTLGVESGKFHILNSNNYGLLMGSDSSGNGWIQAQRVGTTATAYDIVLNPSGGDVELAQKTTVFSDSGFNYIANINQATPANAFAKQSDTGNSYSNAKTGKSYYIINNDTMVLAEFSEIAITFEKPVIIEGTSGELLSVGEDFNIVANIGKGTLHSSGDLAHFSHRLMATTSNFGFRCDPDGDTIANSKTGQSFFVTSNGATVIAEFADDSVVLNQNLIFGPGSFGVGTNLARAYTTTAAGLVIVGELGTNSDILIADRLGGVAIEIDPSFVTFGKQVVIEGTSGELLSVGEAADTQANIGWASIYSIGGLAHFSHRLMATADNFGFRQNDDGNSISNAPTGKSFFITNNRTTLLAEFSATEFILDTHLRPMTSPTETVVGVLSVSGTVLQIPRSQCYVLASIDATSGNITAYLEEFINSSWYTVDFLNATGAVATEILGRSSQISDGDDLRVRILINSGSGSITVRVKEY